MFPSGTTCCGWAGSAEPRPSIQVLCALLNVDTKRTITRRVLCVPAGCSLRALKEKVNEAGEFREVRRAYVFNETFGEHVEVEDDMLLVHTAKVMLDVKEWGQSKEEDVFSDVVAGLESMGNVLSDLKSVVETFPRFWMGTQDSMMNIATELHNIAKSMERLGPHVNNNPVEYKEVQGTKRSKEGSSEMRSLILSQMRYGPADTITRLDLSGCPSQSIQFPDGVSFNSLEEMVMKRCSLLSLAGLPTLPQLRSLDVSHNRISNADQLLNAPNLLRLDLSFNQFHRLSSVSTVIAKLDELKYLNVLNNQFAEKDYIDILFASNPRLTWVDCHDQHGKLQPWSNWEQALDRNFCFEFET